MPYITHSNGQQTFYHDDDFADPWKPHDTIMIQHGYGRTAEFWYHWIPVLSRNYRVIRRDARGHSRSSVPGKDYPYTVDTILDEIVDTLDQLALKKVQWLGESTGGIWGELLAARHPERLHSLTICGSPLYMPKAAGELLAYGKGMPWDALRQLGIRDFAKESVVALGEGGSSDDYKRWWVDEFSASTAYGLADHGVLLWDSSFDARPIMHNIRVPMLLLSPAHSKLVDLDDQRELHAAVAGSKWETIESDSHEIYIEKAEECQRKYLDFVKALRLCDVRASISSRQVNV